MASFVTNSSKKRWFKGALEATLRNLIPSDRLFDVMQWSIAIALGVGLGLFILEVVGFSTQWMALLVLAVLCPFAALVVGNIRKILLAVLILDIPFQMDAFISYRETEGDIGAVGGIIVSLTTISLVILYSLWFAELLTKRTKLSASRILIASIPLMIYVGFGVLSMIKANDLQLSIFGLALQFQMLLVFVYLVGTINSSEDLMFIVSIILVGLIVESVIMIGIRIVGETIEIAMIKIRIDGNRVGGTVGGPNTAGAYLSLLLAPTFAVLLTKPPRLHRWLAISGLVLGTLALFFTLSRGGWLAFLFSTTLFCTLAWYRRWLSPTPIIMAMVGLFAVGFVFQDVLTARLFGSDEGSADSRFPLMDIAFRMISENIGLGVGINNFVVAMYDYAKVENASIWLYAVHNTYLLIWAEVGTGGLLAFLSFLLITVWRGWRGWLYKDRLFSPLALGFALAVGGHMIHLMVDLFNNRPVVQTLWINSALIFIATHLSKQAGLPSEDNRS